MKIDYSKIDVYDSADCMKGLVDFINSKLEALFPDFVIQILPEGIPFMFSMIQWEIVLIENNILWYWEDEKKYMKLKLLLYPAGFRIRPHDVIPYKEEIVLSIQKTIVNVLEKNGGN